MNSAVLHSNETGSPTTLKKLGAAIIKTILYFDIFNYPLTKSEIINCCQYQPAAWFEIDKEINQLVNEGLLKTKDDFYFIGDESIIERRINGNSLAEKYFKSASKYSKLIALFPFVRGIGITGSLSKNYMEKNGDIDYFIITSPHRLWVCRTMLIIFKKIFLFNSHKYFCVNYFIDTNSLEIFDRNIFTATEIVFVLPTYNADLFDQWMNANKWTKEFYPNFIMQNSFNMVSFNDNFFKKFMEKLLNGKIGERLDNIFFRITLKHWKKKFKDFNEDEFDLKMRSKKNVSKHHPNGFQTKVLTKLDDKIAAFEKQFNVKL